MNELSVIENNLPKAFEDVAQFAILAQEKLKSIKAEISAIKRLGLAQEVYEQKKTEAQQLSELAIRAQVRLGEMSFALPIAPGTRTDITSSRRDDQVTKKDALNKLNIKKQAANQYELMAANPEIVEAAIVEAREQDDIVSRSFVLEKIKAKEREDKQSRVAETVTEKRIPTGKYEVIYADPPWRYDFSETKARDIENQYPTMTVEEIAKLQIPSADNAVLFLWATAPKLPEALEVLSAWGFQYKTCAVWDKEKIGMGYWFRGQHELLLVGVKGQVSPPSPQARQSSVYRESRGEHSAKPEHYYELIETMFPDCSCLELFARKRHSERWEVWGNQL